MAINHLTSAVEWIKHHKKPIVVHGLILVGFLLFLFFLSGPLFARFTTIPGEAKLVQRQLPAETNNILYQLDKIITTQDTLELDGWAFIYGHNTDNIHTFIVLKSVESSYLFTTSTVWDNPVTDNYGGPDLNLNWSGFTTTIPVRKITNGTYSIGLFITKDANSALQYTYKSIIKSNMGVKIAD